MKQVRRVCLGFADPKWKKKPQSTTRTQILLAAQLNIAQRKVPCPPGPPHTRVIQGIEGFAACFGFRSGVHATHVTSRSLTKPRGFYPFRLKLSACPEDMEEATVQHFCRSAGSMMPEAEELPSSRAGRRSSDTSSRLDSRPVLLHGEMPLVSDHASMMKQRDDKHTLGICAICKPNGLAVDAKPQLRWKECMER